MSFFQVVYSHPDGTLFADTFGDAQWEFAKGTLVDPWTRASMDVEYFGTTFADEETAFGSTVPTPDGKGRITITALLGKICDS